MKLSVFHCYLIAGLLLLQDIHGLLSTCFNDLSRSLPVFDGCRCDRKTLPYIEQGGFKMVQSRKV